MRRAICCAWLCIALVLIASYDVKARGRKKKDMEPKICKRGKLIFEDDFEGKDIEWKSGQGLFEGSVVKVVQGKLVGSSTKAFGTWRNFSNRSGVVVQFTVSLPEPRFFCIYDQVYGGFGCRGVLDLPKGALAIDTATPGKGQERVAVEQLPRTKSNTYEVLFEEFEGKIAVTTAGKSVTWDSGQKDRTTQTIGFHAYPGPVRAIVIDDVICWEALPLDAPADKEEKTAEAKDEKPEKDKPAEAEKPKEEKAAVELGNALGKDADGKPIVWDISAKGVMRSADAEGKLTKVTLYGPGQMTARIKAQTLVLLGKGEAEIAAGGATQTVTLPGKADIKGGDIITLKAKRGTVQITDVTAE